MRLEAAERGVLEEIIDEQLKTIPILIRLLRIPEIKKYLQIKDESDVVFGMVIGGIVAKFMACYRLSRGQHASKEIESEILVRVLKRADEIREAIFSTG